MTEKTENQGNEAQNTEAPETGTPEAGKTGAQATAPPAGTAAPAALFDMAPQTQKKEDPNRGAAGSGGGAARAKPGTRPEPTKYAEGTEIRYGREKLNLPKEMTAREALAWLAEDDFPELKYESEAKIVYDKDKNRLVVTREAQKKGLGKGPCA